MEILIRGSGKFIPYNSGFYPELLFFGHPYVLQVRSSQYPGGITNKLHRVLMIKKESIVIGKKRQQWR